MSCFASMWPWPESAVNKMIDTYGLKLNQYQFDALIDFCYNCGTSWTLDSSSSFRAAVINGTTGTEFLNAIASWCKAGGSVLDGLIRRRLAEANLYFNGVYSVTPPSDYCYVVFNANGGSSGTSVRVFMSGDVVTDLPTATRSNYSFDGWYTTATSSGTQVTSLDSSMSGSTLYARWVNPDGSPIPEPEEKPVNYQRIVRVDTSLNVREEPDVSAAPIKSLYDGDVVTIVAELQGTDLLWGKLSTGGWVALQYTEPYPEETEEPEEPEEPEVPEEPEEPQAPTRHRSDCHGKRRQCSGRRWYRQCSNLNSVQRSDGHGGGSCRCFRDQMGKTLHWWMDLPHLYRLPDWRHGKFR